MTSCSSKNDADDDPIGSTRHDHDACVSERLGAAEAHCAADQLRFTPMWRKAIEILFHEHRDLGGYTILDRLSEGGFGSHPPLAYRALDFLVANGLVHKIERLKAFIACVHPRHAHTPAFMICRLCDAVAETHSPLPVAPCPWLIGRRSTRNRLSDRTDRFRDRKRLQSLH